MNTIDVLRGAKELLSDESRWCRSGNYALDRKGQRAVATDSREAFSFCALGAIAAKAGFDASEPDALGGAIVYAHPAARALTAAMGQIAITAWNDKCATHADLIDAFDRAILSLARNTKVEREGQRVEVAA